ncbi:MAG: DUF6455 family protein [Pseudomonadota bacterium]
MEKTNEDRAELVNAMAERTGGDVAEGFRQGVMTPRLYRECLDRCAECKDTEACKRLLAEERFGDAPEYCENKDQLKAFEERLRKAIG